jgi:hypothetical protein
MTAKLNKSLSVLGFLSTAKNETPAISLGQKIVGEIKFLKAFVESC